jgi:Domain of unknown function (DUF4760)
MLPLNFAWTNVHQVECWLCQVRDILGAPWVQNLILGITAIIGLSTFWSSSRQETRRATVEALLENLNNSKLQAARITLKRHVDSGLDISYLVSDPGSADRREILSILNRYEFMASGIREGAFDEELYQRMYHNNLVTDWDDLEAFITQLRQDRKRLTAFQELEKLVRAWKKHPLKPYYKTPTKVSRTVSLTVTAAATPTFTLSVLPTSASVTQGSDGTSTITTATESGFDSAVALTASGKPPGVTVSFSPASVAAPGSGKSTMTMAVASTTVPGTYSITVTGAGGGFLRRLRLIFHRVRAMFSRLRQRA